jgi:hypothetical protein
MLVLRNKTRHVNATKISVRISERSHCPRNMIRAWNKEFLGTRSVLGIGKDVVRSVSSGRTPIDAGVPACGSPPHWGKIVRRYLNVELPDRCFGSGGPTAWPP